MFNYCSYSNTIRISPQNYCITVNHGFQWLCDIDAAIPMQTQLKIYEIVKNNSFTCHDPEILVKELNSKIKVGS